MGAHDVVLVLNEHFALHPRASDLVSKNFILSHIMEGYSPIDTQFCNLFSI